MKDSFMGFLIFLGAVVALSFTLGAIQGFFA